MLNKELFDRTIVILVKAYLKGELNAMDCAACACGNLVAANMGYEISRSTYHHGDKTIFPAWRNRFDVPELDETQIASTGYTWNELRFIEMAFMDGASNNHTLCMAIEQPERQDHFAGLMAVCDTLMTIHEANADEIQAAKSLFVLTE